jgi:osmoprotectant transport system permease protein
MIFRGRLLVRNRVALLVVTAGMVGAAFLPFVTHAPNRLVSGRPIGFLAALAGWRYLLLLPALPLLASPFIEWTRGRSAIIASVAAAFVLALLAAAGIEAQTLASGATRAARTSLGSGFWVLLGCTLLLIAECVLRLRPRPLAAAGFAGAALLLLWGVAASGILAQLSLAKEYEASRDVFGDAVVRHLAIVAIAVVPAIALAVPLGIVAHRRRGWERQIFALLNLVQTIPSIALFALLIAPLSSLAAAFPSLSALGVGGVGIAPAIIALVLYSLLPLARNVTAGLAGVPAAAIETARGVGMRPFEVFWHLELPLALPVFLSGLRITLVQAIGLTAVAALIGAGGLGALMFRGLFANALDLVLLGALPIIALAAVADIALRIVASLLERRP